MVHSQPQSVQRGSEVRSVSWAPGANFAQQTAPAATSAYVSAAPAPAPAPSPVPSQNLPKYGPPTTVVAPAQYMMPVAQPTLTMSEQAVPTMAYSAPSPVLSEPMPTYHAQPVATQSAHVPVVQAMPTLAYNSPAPLVSEPVPTFQAPPVATQSAPVVQSPALPALAPTTVVAAAQYMLPTTQTQFSVDQQAMGGVTMTSLPQPVGTETLQVTQAQPLPALAPTTVVAPAQYMTGAQQATT